MSKETDYRLGPEIEDALSRRQSSPVPLIAAQAVNGVAMLSGRLPSHMTLGEIERTALGVFGVTGVADEVGIVDQQWARKDGALAVELVTALALDRSVPISRVKPIVRRGRVRLIGRVWRSADRTAAERCARRVPGVRRLANAVVVISTEHAPLADRAVPR